MIRFGQRLKDERIRRMLTLDDVSVATKIKRDFLAAIEREAYDELPSPAYAKGFVQNYADFLGLPKIQSSALFKRDFDEKRAMKVLPEGMTNSRTIPLKRVNIRSFVVGGLILLMLAGFFLFQTRDMLFAPSIHITSPKEGSVVSRDVEVAGTTSSNGIVTINNNPVFVKDSGVFVKKITLFPGKTTIIIKSKNRLGKESSQTVNLIVK